MQAAILCRPTPDSWTGSRVVVVVAHPDDEVIGCGGLLATLRDASIVQVTDGAPRRGDDAARAGFATPAAYAAARRRESLAALAIADIAPDRLVSLGLADQEAPDHLVAIARALMPLVAGADIVLTHTYEGGHGDHDAVAFAVHAAIRACGHAGALIEMPFYHAGPHGWVRQCFHACDPAEVAVRRLSGDEQARKARMIAAHATQAVTLASFALDAERYRFAPPHDFAKRPHDGPLLYERHGWTLTWPVWQARVQEALAALDSVLVCAR